jgi:hypothetical protein
MVVLYQNEYVKIVFVLSVVSRYTVVLSGGTCIVHQIVFRQLVELRYIAGFLQEMCLYRLDDTDFS